jgi:hypothetical protein
MKQTEFWRWRYIDPESGALKVTRYRMTAEDAQQRFPGAQPVEGSREVHNLPEGPHEWDCPGTPR